jgi:hypothetical protein
VNQLRPAPRTARQLQRYQYLKIRRISKGCSERANQVRKCSKCSKSFVDSNERFAYVQDSSLIRKSIQQRRQDFIEKMKFELLDGSKM